MTNYIYNDGGRKAAGYVGKAGDCGARALAIALELDYKVAYNLIAQANKDKGFSKSARDGVYKNIYSDVLKALGWAWVSAPKFVGRKAKCRDLAGTCIARQAGHFVAVINGVPQDIFDSSEKMVYGFWVLK